MQEYLPIITAIIAALPGIMALINQRKLTEAQIVKERISTAQLVSDMSLDLAQQYKSQIDDLEKRVNELLKEVSRLRQELETYQQGVSLLMEQLQEHKIQPKFTPKKKKGD